MITHTSTFPGHIVWGNFRDKMSFSQIILWQMVLRPASPCSKLQSIKKEGGVEVVVEVGSGVVVMGLR